MIKMSKNLNINNLLCFFRSAQNDYSENVLLDLIYSFYSLKDIKEEKEVLDNIFKKKHSLPSRS